MKEVNTKKIIEELKKNKKTTINFSDGSQIILEFTNLYGINLFIEDKIKTFVRTFKNIKELEKYLTNINIY